MANTYNNMTPAQLVQLATTMDTVLSGGGGLVYGVPPAQKTALETNKTGLGTAIQAVSDTKAASHSAVQGKDLADHLLTGSIAAIAKTVYANPAVTNTMLTALGLAPRPSTRTKHDPITPIDFLATPSVDGNVTLKWNKNGNATGTSFLIEQQGSTGWIFLQSVTGAKTILTGYTPGTSASFRVSASRLGLTSAPSNVSTIYPSGGLELELKVA